MASIVDTRDIRRMTTRTSATSDSSSRKRWAAAKNSGPSKRYATMCSASRARLLDVCSPMSSGTWSSRACPRDRRAAPGRRRRPGRSRPRRPGPGQGWRRRSAPGSSASERVARAIARSEPDLDHADAVASSTPASAASGILATSGAAANTITARTAAWVSAASRDWAPERTLTAVRAIAAGRRHAAEQRGGDVRHALTEQLPSGSWRWSTVMPSATVADSSTPARPARRPPTPGRAASARRPGPGSPATGRAAPAGRAPIAGHVQVQQLRDHRRGRPPRAARTARSGASARRPASPPPPRAPGPRAGQFGCRANSTSARQATDQTFSPSGIGTPSALGTCCRTITAAMPRVKPSTTGAGT